MLTVWRKLNIEFDSMQKVATSGLEKNYEQDLVQSVTLGPGAGQSTVRSNISLAGSADRYAHGFLTVGSTRYEIVSNTDNSAFGDYIVVKGVVPNSAVNHSFKITDDDDRYLDQLGLPPSLPYNQHSAEIVRGIQATYAPAYIQIVDANAMGWNPNQTIPFKLYAEPDSLSGSVFNDAKDLTDSNAFWAFTVTFGYQPEPGEDFDPDGEDFLLGAGSKIKVLNTSYGFAAIYMEVIRDNPFGIGDLSLVSAASFANPVIRRQLQDSYNALLFGTVAHEIGHSTGSHTEAQDHNEGGLMQASAAPITEPVYGHFVPATIKRFRNANNWTH